MGDKQPIQVLTPNSVKTSDVCPQCWGSAVWSPSPSTSHTGGPIHSTQVHVTDSWRVQVTKTGHILTKSPFHGVLNWVRLGYGQGCPLAVALSTRALGMLRWLQGLRGLSLGVTHREPLDKGKRYAQQDARPCRAVGPTRAPQTDHPPPQGSCHQGLHSLLLPLWLDSILKVLSHLNGSMTSLWQPSASCPGLNPTALGALHTWAQVNHSLTHSSFLCQCFIPCQTPNPSAQARLTEGFGCQQQPQLSWPLV